MYLKMESRNNIVKWVPNEVDRLLDEVSGICDGFRYMGTRSAGKHSLSTEALNQKRVWILNIAGRTAFLTSTSCMVKKAVKCEVSDLHDSIIIAAHYYAHHNVFSSTHRQLDTQLGMFDRGQSRKDRLSHLCRREVNYHLYPDSPRRNWWLRPFG